ncbi:CinA family protein [Thalassolituus sp.]|jgi:nicotinamide-nucleotide amidase|uniref:CinA family protein n=1 Tax=Thalassolituus sp. TaxID=2030822 RepID=UPI002A83DFD8|nr:CinA family protein [Thalassolituus sp.]
MNSSVETQVVRLAQCLQSKNLRVATAESCTGGGVAFAMTDLAGSSAWFECGFVTYSNEAKMQHLNVSADVLAAHGAVSEATVIAMVKGAVANSRADVAIAISGIAGPGGGTADKPVGTVWFAWGSATEQQACCMHFAGDRASVREQSVLVAISNLNSWLDE